MAKRKSSDNKAQSDPTTSEDVTSAMAQTPGSEADTAKTHDAGVDTQPEMLDAQADPETLDAGDETVAHGDETPPALDGDTIVGADDAHGSLGDDAVVEPEPEPEPEKQTAPLPVVQPEPQRNTFVPLVFGGVIAAMVGFIAARAEVLDPILPAGMRSQAPVAGPAFDDTALVSGLEAITARMADLEATVAALPEPQPPAEQLPAPEVDLSAINAEIAALSDQIAAIANQPVPAAPVPTDAIDAAVAELRATAAEQQAEIDRLLADARLIRNDAEARATATLARAAMTRIQSAVDNGAPFGAALGDLEQAVDAEVPPQLRDAAANGVPSLAQLQESVPDAARAALAAVREAQGNSGIGGFLQRQLGARSVQPREGSDPDAILSRVEAAVRAGRLGDALAEAETLPAPAQEAMAAWIEQAQSRHDAVSAANALAERLSAF